MDLTTYQKEASRTLLSKPEAPLTDKETMLLWCLTGLVGECWEFYQACTLHGGHDEIVKEAGDVAWYAAGIYTVLGYDILQFAGTDVTPANDALIYSLGHACEAMEQYKKEVFHKHGLNEEELLKKIWLCLYVMRRYLIKTGVTFSSALELNIAKLKARYPEGFSTYDSLNRVEYR